MKFLQDITLGRYMPQDSYVHRLDPRVKFFVLLVLMITVFFLETPIKFALMGLLILLIIVSSRLPLPFVIKGVAPFIWLFIFAAIAHIFFTPGRSVYPFPLGIVNVTHEGLINGATISTRIFFIVVLSSMLTLTTTPLELTSALKRALSPLRRLKIPVNDFAMMMMLTLRFVPILLLESMRVINAQKSRGINFDTGGLFSRAKNLVAILIPLFHLSFVRADELARAMICRGYTTGSDRTSFRDIRFVGSDLIAVVIVGFVLPFFFI